MDKQILDADFLRREFENDLKTILTLFLDESKESIHLLQQALEDKDIEMVRFYAHRLKGSALIVGAKPLADSAQQIEESEGMDGFNRGFLLVERFYSQVQNEAKIILDKFLI